MILNIFGYKITIGKDKCDSESIYKAVIYGKLSRRKRDRLIKDIMSVQLQENDCCENSKITAIKKCRKLYGFRLVQAREFVEKLFPYYERGSVEPVFHYNKLTRK